MSVFSSYSKPSSFSSLTLSSTLFSSLALLSIALLPLGYLRFKSKPKEKKVQKEIIALVGDIGGTNSRFQLIQYNSDSSKPIEILYKKYSTQDAPSLDHNIALFLNDCQFQGKPKPEYSVLAVAGPISKNACEIFSNAEKWPRIDGDEIAKKFELKWCKIINDFQAIGFAITKLKEEDVIQVSEARGEEGQIKSVIGPGTGLGYCKLVPFSDGKETKYYVFGGEGGHASFGPVNREHCEYMNWFMEKEKLSHLCAEKAFAGPGIHKMFQFFNRNRELTEEEKNEKKFTNEIILQKGIKNEDPSCRKVVDLFIEMYASEIGNMILREKSTSGIYLVGSLTNAVKDYLLENKEKFLASCYNKGVQTELVKKVPIYLVVKDHLGLFGSFVEAQRRIS